ncbi:MAG: cobalamin-dependent protein [Pseudomonadota bacterium]
MASDHGKHHLSRMLERLLSMSRRMLGRSPTATTEELASLEVLIENEIIPRLQMTFSTPQPGALIASSEEQVPEYDTAGFVTALLSDDPDNAHEYITDLVASDHSLSQIYEHLLTPAARRLGVMWEDDLCSFANVTIAITKIRHIFIATAPLFPIHQIDEPADPPSILLTTVPGEQHTFGLYLVVETFREAGWTVWSGTPRSTQELTDLVAREHYDIVGLSVVATRNIPAAVEAVDNIRRNSANPDIRVMLGGRIAEADPESLNQVEADLLISDITNVIALADSILVRGQRA